jgi:hypothetical protein
MTYFLSTLSIKTALEVLSKAEITFVAYKVISMKHGKQYFFRCRDRFIEIVM